MTNILIPVKNSWVSYSALNGEIRTGLVEGHITRQGVDLIRVRWHGTNQSELVQLAHLRSGFKLNMDVQDVPGSRMRKSFGEGVVAKTRYIGNRDQVLVDFLSLGKQVWMPYECLRQTKGVKHRFLVGDKGVIDSAERFRLKSLAYALELWNENTGALSSLDIDPLPHQIHLVHQILASGNLNWLIADDVGLGKTIETGMLLAALKQRGQLKRVLLITPAGLTKQWQDELLYKFKLDRFQIYGEDFFINDPRHWKMYDYVIGSIDRLKEENHLEGLLSSDSWDLIIFDEGHRLTRRQYGQRLESSQRFELAARLRNRTDSMIILSATPHQGMQDKFTALLELLRPERKTEISTLSLNPQILRDMVFRNHKADVTDESGKFIFKGKTTKALRLETGEEIRVFDELLQKYLRQGYEAGKNKGVAGNTIGFVMTVYRKLASSSIAAIESALLNRKARLQGKLDESHVFTDLSECDLRYSGEFEESVSTDKVQFFEGEISLLDDLLQEAKKIKENDRKLILFLNELVVEILEKTPDQKVLIFTEYKKTQDYLRGALQKRYGIDSVVVINGSMPHQERKETIKQFEQHAQFLISTEAGGEGINLQRKCHIMVNYDLPWNPMRLVQRIGRLYRYGQDKRVVVFNIHSPGTLDEKIIGLMYSRIDQVIGDLSFFGEEFNENLQDDILGDLADLLDVKQVLNDAIYEGIARTTTQIEEAITKAKVATHIQRDLFQNAASYDPYGTRNELIINQDHIRSFVLGMFKHLGIEVINTTNEGALIKIRLPESVRHDLDLKRERYDVTLDRQLASNRHDTHMLDLDSFLMEYMLEKAKAYEFAGQTAVIDSCSMKGHALIASILRWQNEQGIRLRQELAVYQVSPNGKTETNPKSFSEWLKDEAQTGNIMPSDKEINKDLFNRAERAACERLAEVSNRFLHPENIHWVSSGWLQI